MSLDQWLPNTGSAISVGLGDALGNELHEFPALICPADIPALRNELAAVVAKYGGRYYAALCDGHDGLAFGLDGHDGAGSGPDRPDQVAAASAPATDQAADPATVASDSAPHPLDDVDAADDAKCEELWRNRVARSPDADEPRPVSRGQIDPLPYGAGTNTLFLDVAPNVDDDGASDLCIMLRPGLRRAARLAWIGQDVARRMRPDCEDEAPSEEWVADASESLEVIVESLGTCVEQLAADFNEWNDAVVNKRHCVYLKGDDAEQLARLCELLPGRDARGEPSGINRSLIVVCCALKLLAHTSDPADVISKLDGVAASYINLARRMAAEARTPAEPVDTAAPEPVTV